MKTVTRYDVWLCAKCGTLKEVPSWPHQPPQCCGTGMWFQNFVEGQPYELPEFP